MVASRVATDSSRPPVGYDTMPNDQQVRRWLDSFKGPIADADYTDSMIEAGYDCLENMVFSSDDLMASIVDIKQGHANRIARDAAAMLENMGNVIAQIVEVGPSPVVSTGITGVDSIKVAGPIPAAPTGLITREVFAGWVSRLIPWLRLWSKELANALIERRDNQALSQAALAGKHGWDAGDNIFLGSQLLVTLGGEFKAYLDTDVEDASEGIEIMCIIMDKYMKVDDEYLLGLENSFRDQKPAADASDLSLRLAAWRSDRKMLESKGIPQSELTQKGSLLKVVSKIPEIQAVMDSVEVMQKGKKLSVAELLDLAGRIGDRAPPKSKSNDNNKYKDKNKDKKPTLPHPNPIPIIPPPPIQPMAMVGGKPKRPCLAWGLKGLPECSHGDKCFFEHDPARYKNDHADSLAIAKSMLCKYGKDCNVQGTCYFNH